MANEIFPEAEEASDLYVHVNNGHLTILPEFGWDPLLGNEHKMNQHLRRFFWNYEFPKLFDALLAAILLLLKTLFFTWLT